MKIKICGLTRPEDIAAVNQAGPDYIGFVFWPKSRRYVTPEQAAELKKLLAPDIIPVGVFVNAPLKEIAVLVWEGIIQGIQLHGEETEEDILWLKRACPQATIIKAVQVRSPSDAALWQDSRADFLLLDSGMGSGLTFDWKQIGIAGTKPFFLAGGLGIDNVQTAIDTVHPYGVDVSSGVETEGKKDPEKILELVRRLKHE